MNATRWTPIRVRLIAAYRTRVTSPVLPRSRLGPPAISVAPRLVVGEFARVVGVWAYGLLMTAIDHPTREDVSAQIDLILSRLGVTFDELKRMASDGELVGEEWVAWAEVEELGYLLHE